MTEQRAKKKWGVQDYAQTAVGLLVVAGFFLWKGLDTYNSTGAYQPGVGYAEHGDATFEFALMAIVLLGAIGFGIVAAVAKGNQVGRDD